MRFFDKELLMNFFSGLVAVWHIHLPQGFASHGFSILIEIILQELVVSVATSEVKATRRENQETLHGNVSFVKILHQFIHRAGESKLFQFLVWLFFGIAKPVAEFLNLMGFIIAFLFWTVDVLFVDDVVDVGPDVGDVPIASTISPHGAHSTTQEEHLLETRLFDKTRQSGSKFLAVAGRDA